MYLTYRRFNLNSSQLRQLIGRDEFDYQSLLNVLREYKAPRQKINELIKAQEIIRVKKGLYVFGSHVIHTTYSKEVLANLIYGPSYISLESALSFYKLIPERVETITSVTSKRNKKFHTPVGVFTYRYLHLKKYPLGVLQQEIAPQTKVLMASPEKALIDYITLALRSRNCSIEDVFFDLRLDEDKFLQCLQRRRLQNMVQYYSNNLRKEIMSYIIKVGDRFKPHTGGSHG